MELHLVLTYHWYDVIACGCKNVEYRVIKDRWTWLIWNRRTEITHVKFSRGYTAETMTLNVLGIDIGPCPYKGWNGEYYRIHLELEGVAK
jgi:hypothetical protein